MPAFSPHTCGPWCLTALWTRPSRRSPPLDQQAAALDGQLQQFFATCASAPKCPWKPGGNLSAAFQALLQQVRANPLAAQHTSRTVGPAELLYGTAAALYSTTTWNDLAVSLQAAGQGDGTDLLELFDLYTGRRPDGSYSNVFEANPAIDCLQAPAPSVAALTAALPAAEAAAPVFGAAHHRRSGDVRGLARPGDRNAGAHTGRGVASHRGGRQHRRPDHAVPLGPIAGG